MILAADRAGWGAVRAPAELKTRYRLRRWATMRSLRGKTALVPGGSRRSGRAVVERLARDGAEVVFSFARREAAASEVLAAVEASGREPGRCRPISPSRASLARPVSTPPRSTSAGSTLRSATPRPATFDRPRARSRVRPTPRGRVCPTPRGRHRAARRRADDQPVHHQHGPAAARRRGLRRQQSRRRVQRGRRPRARAPKGSQSGSARECPAG